MGDLQGGKNVVLTVSTINSSGLVEALRLAVGIATGKKGHKVSVIFTGDGVAHCISGARGNSAELSKAFENFYLASRAHGVALYLDKHCLSLRSISENSVRSEMKILEREEMLSMLSRADSHLRL